MENLNPQLDTSKIFKLESANSAALLRPDEIDAFKKLPKDERRRQQRERLSELEELNNNFRNAISEATKTGNIDEAKRLKTVFEEKAGELKQLIGPQEISAEYKYKDEKGRKK